MKFAARIVFTIQLFLCSCLGEYFITELEGNLVGYVYTFDEFGGKLGDCCGILVSALGVKRIYKTLPEE